LDFEKWAGLYEVWLDRQRAYQEAIRHISSQQPSLLHIIQPAPM
jgi:hypothetical protein